MSLSLDPPEQLLGDPRPDDRVQRREGFVHQEELGPEGKHLCDGDPLPLSARELRRIALAERRVQPHPRHPLPGDLGRLANRRSADPEAERDVLPDRPPWEQRIVLEEKADLGTLHPHLDLSTGRLEQSGHGAKDACLARARGAEEGGELTGLDVEIHILEHRVVPVGD